MVEESIMNNVYRRPMFQNPQQRAGGGIMAGVAPVNMSEGGGFFSFEETPEGSGVNLKDVQKFLFDPNDPVDQASLALATVPGVNIVAKLVAMGLKGAKLYKQINKIEKFREATKNSAKYAGSASVALQAGDFVSDPQVRSDASSLAEDIPYLAKSYYDEYTTPEERTTYDQSAPSFSDDYENVLDNVASGDYSESPNYDPDALGIASQLGPNTQSEEDSEGGIADLANSIAEAREMKAATFKRGDEELAAVTAEDLAESGFDSLTDYLNNMEFDEDVGRYTRKIAGKANGGIMRLKDGSGPDGVEKEEIIIDKDLKDFFNAYTSLDPEKFLALSDEDKQVYLDAYKEKLEFKENLRQGADNSPLGLAKGVASLLDVANSFPEKATELYRDFRYGDTGKALGLSQPLEERPNDDESFVDVGDPTFRQIIDTPINTDPLAGRSREDIINVLNPPAPPKTVDTIDKLEEVNPAQEMVETTEERPGFIESAYDAVKDYYGMGGTSENEKNAQRVANNTRRKYGTSWQEVYNEALAGLELQDAKIAESKSIAESRSISEMQQEFEYLQSRFPDLDDDELMDKYTLFKRSKSRTGEITNSDIFEAKQAQAEDISKNFLTVYQEDFKIQNDLRAAKKERPLTKSEYINLKASQMVNSRVNAQFGIQNTPASSVAASISTDGKEINQEL